MPITKALSRLRVCAGWSAPLLFANPGAKFSRFDAHLIFIKTCFIIIIIIIAEFVQIVVAEMRRTDTYTDT